MWCVSRVQEMRGDKIERGSRSRQTLAVTIVHRHTDTQSSVRCVVCVVWCVSRVQEMRGDKSEVVEVDR